MVHAALEEAYRAAYEEDWDAAIRKLEWILRVDPDYVFARHLRERVAEWRVKFVDRQSLVFALEEWTRNAQDCIPFRDSFHPPLPSTLEQLMQAEGAPEDPRRRQPKGGGLSNLPVDSGDYADDAALYRRINSTRITLTGGTTFAYFVDGLQDVTNLNIGLDRAVLDLLGAECRVELRNELLCDAFKNVLSPLGLTFRVERGRLILGIRRNR